jgi:hypothetical protein
MIAGIWNNGMMEKCKKKYLSDDYQAPDEYY